MSKKLFIRRFIIIALCLIMCFPFISCGKKETPSQSNNALPPPIKQPVYTGDYIVSPQGNSDYSILIPAERDEIINLAIKELLYGIEQTCGFKMNTTTTYDPNKKYISVGKTPLYLKNKAAVDGVNGLDEDNTRILSVDDDIIIMGGSEDYVVYSVYDFMEQTFGFKWFTFDDAKVVKSDHIKLLKFDYKFKPTLHFRAFHQYDYWIQDILQRNKRMRTQNFDNSCYVSGHTVISYILPKSMYLQDHPEWYTKPIEGMGYETTGQLCLTNEEMIEEFIKRSKEIIMQNWNDKSREYFFIGMEDDWDYCKCDKCVAQAKKYSPTGEDTGNRSANFIIFANKVEKAINEWVKTLDPNKTIKFFVYAYFHNLQAPVKTNADGSYSPVSPDVIPNENISILYAPLNNDFTYSWNDDRNSGIKTVLDQWQAVTKNISGYSYDVPYGSVWLPMNDLLTMGGTYGMAAERGYFGFMEEGRTYQRQFTMQRLKNYIKSQLWWNIDSGSVDELAYEFIDFYYQPVAEEFKKYYATTKQWQIYQTEELGLKMSIMSGYGDAKFWPYEVLCQLNDQLDNMIKILEDSKKIDPSIYDTYFDRINSEKVWIYYTIANYYKNYYNREDYLKIVDFVFDYGNEYKMLSEEQKDTINAWRI